MRIERLVIDNFRRFRRVDLELPDGVVALVGRNGAGKSTLLESIGWCLYGHEAARTGKDLLKRRGAAPGDDVRVHLAFRHGAHHYEVTRELLGKGETHVATVKVDGKVAVPAGAQSQREASAYVARLFHMDREAFFKCLVARQRELAALTEAKPSERKRLLIGLLRLDAVDEAISQARLQKRDARGKLEGLRAAARDLPTLREELQRVRLAIDADGERLRGHEAGIQAMEARLEDARARRDAGRKLADEHRRLGAEAALAQERAQHARRERARREQELALALQAAQEADALAPRVALLPQARERLERLTSLRARHEQLQRVAADVARHEAELARAAKDEEDARGALAAAGAVRALSARVAAERPRVEGVVAEHTRRAAELAARLAELARQEQDLLGKERRIREMGAETPCPTCTRPLQEHHDALLHGFSGDLARLRAQRAETEPQLDAARRQEAECRRSLADLATREEELRVKLAGLAKEEQRLQDAQARRARSEEALARQRAERDALAAEPYDAAAHDAARREAADLQKAHDRWQRLLADAARADEARRVVAELDAQERDALAVAAERERERGLLGFDAAAHQAVEAEVDAAERALQDARIQRERIVGERRARVADAKRLAEEIARQEDLQKRAQALETRVRLLEQLAADRDQGLLPDFKDHLIGRIRPVLSLHAGRLFRDLTDGRYADLEVDEGYDLKVHDDGQAFALERFSGGEGDLANLCLRLAVSQVVAERAGTDGFGFLALDEIFGSQDDGRRANILRALQQLSSRFRQILVISHIADVKEACERVLRVEALDDGTSRVWLETG